MPKVPGLARFSANNVPATADSLLALRVRDLWAAFWADSGAFIGLSIYLLLEYLKPDQAYPVFALLPLIKIFIAVTSIAFLFDRRAKIRASLMTFLFFLLLVQCCLSSIYAYKPQYSYDHLNIILTWFVVYLLITGIVTNERRLFLFMLVYFLANLKMSQFGFFSWAHRGFGFTSWGITGAGWFRNSGELGMQMAMFFAYTTSFIFYMRPHWSRKTRVIMYFLPLSALACVVASSSRGAVVSVLAALLYFSFFGNRKFRLWLAIATIVALIGTLLPPEFIQRFHAAGKDATSLARIEYWGHAKEMLRTYPYFGAGYYNWIPYYADHYFDTQVRGIVEEAHNTFLQLGAELGYPGLWLFGILLIYSFYLNWRSAQLSAMAGLTFLRSLALGMNAAALALVAGSMFLTAFFMPNYWIHFALSVSLATITKVRAASVLTVKKPSSADAARSTNLPANETVAARRKLARVGAHASLSQLP